MAYFDMFPLTFYRHKSNSKPILMTDLLARVKIVPLVRENIVNFDYYYVQDGETPEMIAYKYYGDVNLHWTILAVNEVVDYYEDWPMSVQKFEQFVKEKYENPQAIHHYEISQVSGDTEIKIDVGMNTTEYPSATAISNYQYEDRLQTEKRQIRLITPAYIQQFATEFERKLKETA